MIPTPPFWAALLLTLPAYVTSTFTNLCPQPTTEEPNPPAFFYGHPTDSRYFITCAHGNPNLLQCPPYTLWNQELQACTGSEFNGAHNSPCSGGASLVPHATSCQRYYNCSHTGAQWNRFFEKFEAECPYPQLFDARELRCKPYGEAFCDLWRVAAKDPCDYLANKCGSGHCEPCSSRLPSCVGYPDGTYQHPGKLNSPYQMLCVNQRLYRVFYCTSPPAADTTKPDCHVTWQSAF
ncbi:hypothetical protein BsWGS_26084 [Bradybaena similaris]